MVNMPGDDLPDGMDERAIQWDADKLNRIARADFDQWQSERSELDRLTEQVLYAYKLADDTEDDPDDLWSPWRNGDIRIKSAAFTDAVLGLIFPATRYVTVEAANKQVEIDLDAFEDYFWYIIKEKVRLHERARRIVKHTALTPGYLARVRWERRLDRRSGKELGWPEFDGVPYWNFCGDTTYQQFEDCAFVCVTPISVAELRRRARAGLYDADVVEAIIEANPEGESLDVPNGQTMGDTVRTLSGLENTGGRGFWVYDRIGFVDSVEGVPDDKVLWVSQVDDRCVMAREYPTANDAAVLFTVGVDPMETWYGEPWALSVLPFEQNINRIMAPAVAGLHLAVAPPIKTTLENKPFVEFYQHVPGKPWYMKDIRGVEPLQYNQPWGQVMGYVGYLMDKSDQLSAVPKNITAGDPKPGVTKYASQQQGMGAQIRLGQDADQLAGAFTKLTNQMLDLLIEMWDADAAIELTGDQRLAAYTPEMLREARVFAKVDALSRANVNELEQGELGRAMGLITGNPALMRHVNTREAVKATVQAYMPSQKSPDLLLIPEETDGFLQALDAEKAKAAAGPQAQMAGPGPGPAAAQPGMPPIPPEVMAQIAAAGGMPPGMEAAG